ncbi:MAG: PAS domain S-box protein [Bryobacteraceae bacterium]|jgi:PAS domain S-box-containing protein
MVSLADILNARILVVDDQEANVRLLEGMLRIAGYTSIESTMDPFKVCELHRKNRYSLILLDLQMPGMDGFQVMEGLKEIEEDGYLPVLVITAQPAHKLRALEAGAKDFVSKPFDLAELRARVHNILEVRLLHLETKNYSKVLEETVRELEASREVVRLFDIAEHKAAEERLHVLSDALEQSPVSIVITDLKGNIEYVNPRTTETTGYTFEELKGKNPRILKSGYTSEEEYRTLWATIPTGEWHGTFHNKKKNGELFWETASIRPILDASGKPTHYLAVKEDVTARKLAEDKIVWLASFPEQNPNPVIEIEVPSGVVRYVNPAARDLFPDLQQQGLAHAWLAGLEQFGEVSTRAAGNETRPDVIVGDRCWARTTQYLPEARRLRVYATDITQRKRAEESLRQSQSQLLMAQKLESIGQLAAGIAHEINTPIQYIGDNATFLAEAFRDLIRFVEPHAELAGALLYPGRTDFVTALEQSVPNVDVNYLRDEIPKATEQLLEGVAHVARIVRAMKEFSHPGPVEKAPVDINRAIESTILVSKNEWKYVAGLTTDLDPELPLVPCMGGEFNQVILNLIVNATHAISDVVRDSNQKGSIRISTRRDGGWAEVRVSDTGAGIPEGIRARIFTPFFTTKEVGKGTGQGLAMAHSVIVKKHQGTIHFESEIGVGTTFVVRLPLQCVGEKP